VPGVLGRAVLDGADRGEGLAVPPLSPAGSSGGGCGHHRALMGAHFVLLSDRRVVPQIPHRWPALFTTSTATSARRRSGRRSRWRWRRSSGRRRRPPADQAMALILLRFLPPLPQAGHRPDQEPARLGVRRRARHDARGAPAAWRCPPTRCGASWCAAPPSANERGDLPRAANATDDAYVRLNPARPGSSSGPPSESRKSPPATD
jgi:hypothetical protein